MKRSSGVALLKGSIGISTILGGDCVLAAMLLGGLLSASPSSPAVGKLAAEGSGDGPLASFSEMIVAFCSLLLNPTAMCCGFVHSAHCGLPHGLCIPSPGARRRYLVHLLDHDLVVHVVVRLDVLQELARPVGAHVHQLFCSA
jgi:hypothetical protein